MGPLPGRPIVLRFMVRVVCHSCRRVIYEAWHGQTGPYQPIRGLDLRGLLQRYGARCPYCGAPLGAPRRVRVE